MQNLRVLARFRSGVVCDQWLPLDSILHAMWCRDQLGPEVETRPGQQGVELDMPFLAKRHEGQAYWHYACSWAQPQPWWIAEGKDHWNKQFDTKYSDLIDFKDNRGKVIVEKGENKSYHMPVFYRLPLDAIEWYCVGDKSEIERLLSCCLNIGKKRSQGWGRVMSWTVEEWPEDCSVWRDEKLMRGVPVVEVGAMPMNMHNYGIRPSYYNPNNQMLLVLPNGTPEV